MSSMEDKGAIDTIGSHIALKLSSEGRSDYGSVVSIEAASQGDFFCPHQAMESFWDEQRDRVWGVG